MPGVEGDDESAWRYADVDVPLVSPEYLNNSEALPSFKVMSKNLYILLQAAVVAMELTKEGGSVPGTNGTQIRDLFNEIVNSPCVAELDKGYAEDHPRRYDGQLYLSAIHPVPHYETLDSPAKRFRANPVDMIAAVPVLTEDEKFQQAAAYAFLEYLNGPPLDMKSGYSMLISGFERKDERAPVDAERYVHLDYSRKKLGGAVTMKVDVFETSRTKPTKSLEEEYWLDRTVLNGGKKIETLLFTGLEKARGLVSPTTKTAKEKKGHPDTDARHSIAIKMNPSMTGIKLGEKTHAWMGNVKVTGEAKAAS